MAKAPARSRMSGRGSWTLGEDATDELEHFTVTGRGPSTFSASFQTHGGLRGAGPRRDQASRAMVEVTVVQSLAFIFVRG